MTKTQSVAAAVTMLSETFRQPLSEAGAKGYILGVEELTVEQVGMVCRRALRECKFMPTPAELLALAGKAGPQVLAAEIAEAWTAARRARRVHSYTTGVDFGPLVNAVIRSMGGWLVFCGHNDDALEAFERKKFETAYAAFRARGELGSMGEPLRGEFPGVERVAIGGQAAPARQLESKRGPVADVVRELAEAKAAG
jgi:hypothetical protein